MHFDFDEKAPAASQRVSDETPATSAQIRASLIGFPRQQSARAALIGVVAHSDWTVVR